MMVFCVTVRTGRKKSLIFLLVFFRLSKVGQVMCYRCCGTSVYQAKTSSLRQFILLSFLLLTEDFSCYIS